MENLFWGVLTWGAIIFFAYKFFVAPWKAGKAKRAVAVELNHVADEVLAREQARIAEARARGPVIDLCVGTGRLASERNHVSGIPAGKHVLVDSELAAQGIVVVGPTGSGKTRAVLQKIAAFWLQFSGAGLFAFAEKANWSRKLVRIAKFAGLSDDQIHVVGPGKQPWPLLRGLSPEHVANFVRIAMEKGGRGDSNTEFFANAAANLVRRTANVLLATSQYGPIQITSKTESGEVIETFSLDYDLFSVSKVARMPAAVLERWVVPEIRTRAAVLEAQGNSDAKRQIDADLPELIIAASLEGKSDPQRAGITGHIDNVLAPFFTDKEFTEAFSGTGSFDLSVLDRGEVVILDTKKYKYPNASTLAFLLGFEQMKLYMNKRTSRLEDGDNDDLNPVLFLADEYAQVACSEHLDMWRISREANIAPVLAYQTHTDLQGAIGIKVADGMMHNFATKMVFGTSDPASIALVQAGKAEVERESVSEQSSWHSGSSSSNSMGGIGSSGSSEGESGGTTRSTAVVERAVVDEQLMDSLSNRIKRHVPINEQRAEVVVRSIIGSRRVCDVCVVSAWDPPRLYP